MSQYRKSSEKEIGAYQNVSGPIFIHLFYTSIFVVHKDMNMDSDGPEWDPHEYWKMKIISMHKDGLSGKKWVVGTWFYTPTQLKDIKLKERDRYFQ
jgi:hypothetical protein